MLYWNINCGLADKIIRNMQPYGLNISKLLGWAYGQARNMAGSVNGIVALISGIYLLAIYFHCASHHLNLAIVHAFQNYNHP